MAAKVPEVVAMVLLGYPEWLLRCCYAVARIPGWLLRCLGWLLGYLEWLLRFCYAVAMVPVWLLECAYVVARVLMVVSKVLLCGC